MTVRPGDPLKIAARDWNVLEGVAERARRNQLGIAAASSFTGGPAGAVVPIKNATGSTVSRYHAVGLGDPLVFYTDNAQTFLNEFAFSGETMSSSYAGQYAIMQETVANGKIGMGLIDGVSVAAINVGDAGDTTVDADPSGGTRLISGTTGGGQILYKESGTGDKWAIVRAGINVAESTKKQYCRFTLDAALATTDANKAATIQSQWGTGTDHSTSITVNNLLTHTAGTYVFEGDSGDAGIAIYSGSGSTWYIIQMECP
jgi:hypothetical protein